VTKNYLTQIDLLAEQRNDLYADHELIRLDQRRRVRRLAATHGNPIGIRAKPRKVEAEIANAHLRSSSFAYLFLNLSEHVSMKPLAVEDEVSRNTKDCHVA
jgi:hypothetical protein